MVRSYRILKEIETECTGFPEKKFDPVKINVEIAELWGSNYAVSANCKFNNEENNICKKTNEPCYLNELSSSKLKRRFFPDLNLIYLEPSD